MITLEDIANATFRKAKIGGYNPEDVNEFLDQVQVSFAQIQKEKMELVRKLEILAKKVEEYREEEESIRNTLFSAQKLADASVREAKHKSEVILKDASTKAERIVSNAQAQIMEQQDTLQTLQREVSSFRSRLLAIYKEHLTLIDALPTEEKPVSEEEKTPAAESKPQEPKPAEEPAAAPAVPTPAEEPEAMPAQPAAAPVQAAQQAPVAASPASAAAASVSEPPVVAVPFAPDPATAAPAQGSYPHSGMTAIEEAEAREKFGELQFGEGYHVRSNAEESPLGLFKHKK